MSEYAIRTEGLTKQFRTGQVAVNDLTLAVPAGSVFGFLGPNGSGKTTTIRMLLGLLAPTSGTIAVLNEAISLGGSPALDRVGALVEGPAFHPYLSARANLSRMQACDRTQSPKNAKLLADEALERVGLSEAANKKYRQFSLGMKQRLGLAAALLRPRDLLILDEPTNGLDPQGTREVRHLILELASEGSTIFVSSHLLAEIDQMCTSLAIMGKGHLLFQGEIDELRRRGAHLVTIETTANTVDLALATIARLELGEPTVHRERIEIELGNVLAQDLSSALVRDGVELIGFTARSAQLEDLFVELTGEGFDVAS